ncbi:MAG: DHHA1 domain-containing protein, partial [Ardenticatenales bacterium]
GTLFAPDRWSAQPTLVVDHHISNTGFGDIDCIVPTASSTCELLVSVIDALGADISADAATCLLCGILTDTIGLRTPSTSAATLDVAARLVRAGADIGAIARRVFQSRPLASLRLEGRVLDRLTLHGPFVISYLTLSDLAELGAVAEDGRGIVQTLGTAAEPLAVALLRERDDGWFDVSLRAKAGTDLVPAAAALGGGGHALAAGARTPGPLDAALGAVRRVLSEHVQSVRA